MGSSINRLRAGGDVKSLGVDFNADDAADNVPKVAFMNQEGLYVGAGTLKIKTINGTVVTFADGELAAGVCHPLRISRVYSTGTTATDLKLVYN